MFRATRNQKTQCPASFKTPNGELYYCQHRNREGHDGPHIYNVVQHAVQWKGTANEKTGWCGDPTCINPNASKLEAK